jgi:hypothetical protein
MFNGENSYGWGHPAPFRALVTTVLAVLAHGHRVIATRLAVLAHGHRVIATRLAVLAHGHRVIATRAVGAAASRTTTTTTTHHLLCDVRIRTRLNGHCNIGIRHFYITNADFLLEGSPLSVKIEGGMPHQLEVNKPCQTPYSLRNALDVLRKSKLRNRLQ